MDSEKKKAKQERNKAWVAKNKNSGNSNNLGKDQPVSDIEGGHGSDDQEDSHDKYANILSNTCII